MSIRIMSVVHSMHRVDMITKRIKSTLISHPILAYRYARYTIEGRWPEGEPIISSDPEIADWYASIMIGGAWPEAEKTIATSGESSLSYAGTINKRFEAGEPAILKQGDIRDIIQYCNDYLNGGEIIESFHKVIEEWLRSDHPDADILNRTLPAVMRYYNGVYGLDRKRWEALEDMFGGLRPDVVGRFGIAPHAIKYALTVGVRIPAIERVILADADLIPTYASDVIAGRWPEAEEKLLRSRDIGSMVTYAKNAMETRWPELEKLMKELNKSDMFSGTDMYYVDTYIRHFRIKSSDIY